jgi:hypothetical protein
MAIKKTNLWPPDHYTAMVAKSVGECIKGSLAPILQRLDELETQYLELVAQKVEFKYVGTWRSGKAYQRGNFCTHSSALWHCNEPTTETPGKCNDWTLCVKAPR